MLSNLVEGVLDSRSHSNSGDVDRAVAILVEHATLMMGSDNSITKRAGSDLASTILASLKNYNILTKEHLPKLLMLSATTNEIDFEITFDELKDYFLEKIQLYDLITLKKMCRDLWKILLDVDYNEFVYPMLLEKIISAIKSVFDVGNIDGEVFDSFMEHFDAGKCDDKLYFAKSIAIISKIDIVFDLGSEQRISFVQFAEFFALIRSLKWSQTFYSKLSSVEDYFLFFSILNLLERFADLFLEYKYQNTIELLCIVITTMPAVYVKKIYKNIYNCLNKYFSIWKNNHPHAITNSIHMWLKSLQIYKLTEQLNNGTITTDNYLVINSIKLMLSIVNLNKNESVFADDIYDKIKTWPSIVLRLFSKCFDNSDKTKMAALTDALTVAMFFKRQCEIVELVVEGQKLFVEGTSFCQKYIMAFADSFIKTDILNVASLKPHLVVLLYELLRYYGRRKCSEDDFESMFKLIESHWLAISASVNPSPIQVLQALTGLGRTHGFSLESKAALWVLEAMCEERADLTYLIKCLEVLPAFLNDGNRIPLYNSAIRRFVARLPLRLAELAPRSDPRAFSAILDCLSQSADLLLLGQVLNFSTAEEKYGWWDSAIEQCMIQLSAKNDVKMALELYNKMEESQTLNNKLCTRMLLPLLRYSNQRVNEEFFSETIVKILGRLGRELRSASASFTYMHTLVQYTNCFMLLQLMFEKVSSLSLESPNSDLNKSLNMVRTWFLPAEVCRLCLTLRARPCPEGATGQCKELYRQYHCANYNCMGAALCKRKPDLKFYEKLFTPDVWRLLLDCEKNYVVYIEPVGKLNMKRHKVSVETEGSLRSNLSIRTMLTHRPLFLKTLSDNPLQYDLLADNLMPEEVETQELLLTDNELNSHECSATLSAILCHLYSLNEERRPYWIENIASVLCGSGTMRNIKWFLSQVIINCKDEMYRYLDVLVQPLLSVVADTPYDSCGRKCLNGLHINIFKTIIKWHQITTEAGSVIQTDSPLVSKCIDLLIETCYVHSNNKYVFKNITNVMTDMVKLNGTGVKICFERFKDCFEDATNQELSLQIITLLTKSSIYIPEILPNTIKYLQQHDRMQARLKELSELFGSALSVCQHGAVKVDSLKKFWGILQRLHQKNVNDYIKILYYSQVGCKDCVDENNFRIITDLTPKMIATTKDKCYSIIANYISAVKERDEYITEMFDSINISELILEKDSYEALKVAKNGFRLMSGSLKRRIVLLICDVYCNTTPKVRRLACELILEAIKDTLKRNEEPSAKRVKTDIPNSHVIHCLLTEDFYGTKLLTTLGKALMDREQIVASVAFDGALELLDRHDLALRFCEIIALTMVLTSNLKSNENMSSGNTSAENAFSLDAARCCSVAIKLWIHELEQHDSFKKTMLKDIPKRSLNASQIAGTSRLLTMSNTYRGTLRTTPVLSKKGKQNTKMAADKRHSEPDLSVNLKDLFDSFVRYSEKSNEFSSCFLMELFKIVLSLNCSNEWRRSLAIMIRGVFQNGRLTELIPTLTQMCRLFVSDCCRVDGFSETVLDLCKRTVGSEGEYTTRLLYEDTILHTDIYFPIDIQSEYIGDDDQMEGSVEFSIEDLSKIFGKLSNWDKLTLQQRDSIRRSETLVFFIDNDTLLESLDSFDAEANTWVGKLYSAYKSVRTDCQYRWLREIDTWPRRKFFVSTITEAVNVQMSPPKSREDLLRLPQHIGSADCLAEWAVRLMIRSLSASSVPRDSEQSTSSLSMSSRRQELLWCSEANRRSLSAPALQCIERNTVDLLRNETLPWLLQQIYAMRNNGLMVNNNSMLERALEKAETYLSSFGACSDAATVIDMYGAMLELRLDLKELTPSKIEEIIINCKMEYDSKQDGGETGLALKSLVNAHKTALNAHLELLEYADDSNILDIVSQSCACISSLYKYSGRSSDPVLAAILKRISSIDNEDNYKMAAMDLFEKLETGPVRYDEVIVDELKRAWDKISKDIEGEKFPKLHQILSPKTEVVNVFSEQLKLLRCPQHSLQQYSESLYLILTKSLPSAYLEWREICDSVYGTLFDNVNAGGAAYQLLNKYKSDFNKIREFESTKAFKTNAMKVLKSVLLTKNERSSISLEELCPALSSYPRNVCERDRNQLNLLLHIDEGVSIVRFEKQVRIFTNSKKRPVLVRALLSNGRARGFLVKMGEDVRTDATCQTVLRCLNAIAPYKCVTYWVTPLGQDGGVIEFLEDHITLRGLLSKSYTNLDDIGNNRVSDEELILQPSKTAVSHHNTLCQSVPAYALRHCISNECSSVQEFVRKKEAFLNSFSAMTISHWILGLGDRHLENIMYGLDEGTAVSVDWAAILDSAVGGVAPEIPCARLTRVMRAVDADDTLLESRLQNILAAIRKHHRQLTAVISIAFKWRSDFETEDIQNKLKSIEGKIDGSMLSYKVTRNLLAASDNKYRDQYVELMDNVFERFEEKPVYTIVEQVQSLLIQCSDPRILSVTRAGFEPWL